MPDERLFSGDLTLNRSRYDDRHLSRDLGKKYAISYRGHCKSIRGSMLGANAVDKLGSNSAT